MSTVSRRIVIDSENRLVIHEVSSSKFSGGSCESFVDQYGKKKFLRKILLNGKWGLTEDHDLVFKLLARSDYIQDTHIILKGEIVKTTGSSLAFRVRGSENLSGLRSSTVELKGVWAADKNNRITFKVAKAKGRNEILRFQGAWKISRSNEVVYRYERVIQKTKTKKLHRVVFNGTWHFEKNRIIYRLEGSTDSFFSFTCKLASNHITSSGSKIKYQVGVRFTRGRRYRAVLQKIEIFGKWSLTGNFSCEFTVGYRGGRKEKSVFSVQKLYSKGKTLTVSVVDKKGYPLGLEVKFDNQFANDAELFVSLSKYAKDITVLGGVRVRF